MAAPKPVLLQARTLRRLDRPRRRLESLADVRGEMIRNYLAARRGRMGWDECLKRTAILTKIAGLFDNEPPGNDSEATGRPEISPSIPGSQRIRELLDAIAGVPVEAAPPLLTREPAPSPAARCDP